ncbi:patatin-like phospholipase family protein [Hydrogenimonas urashimensis]|uniref:patatin-like phospholipase family protein n=1 Tax=Hydrogenimonas urashimensis TaxID=2740515 RepID=UPI0019158748|nr:patatin-like phospholipase family protein [Hydrogenimonas urashimensis]
MKAALALSGGGIRAVAHLGIVKVLKNNGVEIEAIAGASGGALVGALLCDGKEPEEIVEMIKAVKLWNLFGSRGRGGVFALEGIRRLLEERLSVGRIERLRKRFFVACTDLAGGEIRYFDRGAVGELCIASSSLVPVFSPVRYDGMLLADGGFMDNMPARPLKPLGLPVIGINVNPILPKKPDNVIRTTVRALVLMMAANIEASRRHCHFYVEPAACERINIFDFKKIDEAYDAGIKEGEKVVSKLLDTIGAI